MTNLFGLVSTDPAQLYRVEDPVGPENDRYILQAAQETGKIVAAWGLHGGHQKRCHAVSEMLAGFVLMCLKETKEGYPTHPLYVAGDTKPARYKRMGVSLLLNTRASEEVRSCRGSGVQNETAAFRSVDGD